MGITEILRRTCLFPANKIKSSESFSKQPTQLIIAAHNCHICHLALLSCTAVRRNFLPCFNFIRIKKIVMKGFKFQGCRKVKTFGFRGASSSVVGKICPPG